MKVKLLISIVAFIAVTVASIVYGIPLGKEKGGEQIIGKSQNGREIILESIIDRRIYPLSVEGFFKKDASYLNAIYERHGRKNIRLDFLDKPLNYGLDLIEPVMAIENSEKWGAFQEISMTRTHARLRMYVFDKTSILGTVEINEAIRTNFDDQRNAKHFSISQSPEGHILINTMQGEIKFDPAINRFVNSGRVYK